MTPPLFARALGSGFETLDPAVRALHSVAGGAQYRGRADIRRGRHWLVPLLAWGAHLPPTQADVPASVHFLVDAGGERWSRRFGDHPMQSRLWVRQGRLRERLGAVQFEFDLQVDQGAIRWRVRRVWLAGVLAVPARWFDGVRCREYEQDGRYAFDVAVTLPWIGPFIRYEGWLEPS
ncbi:DUF4166 domain-containing protein [Stenotrophomonas sp. TWI700]|uniref:DUF4166 domain-containing protein n=1 Tax=Stenotrophomonas sp. TWI700 TaxID=3136792 RepID=UPI003208BC8F